MRRATEGNKIKSTFTCEGWKFEKNNRKWEEQQNENKAVNVYPWL